MNKVSERREGVQFKKEETGQTRQLKILTGKESNQCEKFIRLIRVTERKDISESDEIDFVPDVQTVMSTTHEYVHSAAARAILLQLCGGELNYVCVDHATVKVSSDKVAHFLGIKVQRNSVTKNINRARIIVIRTREDGNRVSRTVPIKNLLQHDAEKSEQSAQVGEKMVQSFEVPQKATPQQSFEAPKKATPQPSFEAPQLPEPQQSFEAPQKATPQPSFEVPQNATPQQSFEAPQIAMPMEVKAEPEEHENQPQAAQTRSHLSPYITEDEWQMVKERREKGVLTLILIFE